MPPKTQDPRLEAAIEEYEAICIVKGDMALDAYNVQTKATKAVIDNVRDVLKRTATGTVSLKVGRTTRTFKLGGNALDASLLYMAVEIVKDLAFVGIKVAGFKFDPSHCADCGSEL